MAIARAQGDAAGARMEQRQLARLVINLCETGTDELDQAEQADSIEDNAMEDDMDDDGDEHQATMPRKEPAPPWLIRHLLKMQDRCCDCCRSLESALRFLRCWPLEGS